MDFQLSEEQQMLKTMAREFLCQEFPASLARRMKKDDKGYQPELYQKMADLGWLGLCLPNEYGGSGGSLLDLVQLVEEMGRVSLSGPFFGSVLSSLAILELGSNAQKSRLLPRVANGEIKVAMAFMEPDVNYDLARAMTTATASGSGVTIDGHKLFVADAHVSDFMICTARDPGSARNDVIGAYLVPASSRGITIRPLDSMSGQKQSEVTFKKVEVLTDGILSKDAGPGLEKTMQIAAICYCAMMVGAAGAALESAVEHSKQRVQFGRPIGSFQAIQHHSSNMLTDLDCSRFLCYRAAWLLSERKESTKEVSMAKAAVSDAFGRIMLLAHQIHGGVGIMEDHVMPLFSTRIVEYQYGFGDADHHREIVAQQLGL